MCACVSTYTTVQVCDGVHTGRGEHATRDRRSHAKRSNIWQRTDGAAANKWARGAGSASSEKNPAEGEIIIPDDGL